MPSLKKLNRRKSVAAFTTWSLNDKLRGQCRQEELFEDMRSKKIGFAALQEMTWSKDAEEWDSIYQQSGQKEEFSRLFLTKSWKRNGEVVFMGCS